jgi:hypothetical protein
MFGSSRPPEQAAPAPEQAVTAPEQPKSPSFRERVAALFHRAQDKTAEPGRAEAVPNAPAGAAPDCPTIEIRSGASTYAVGPQGENPSAINLRFQATIARTARECSVSGGNMTMKVGIQGRIILGPAGAPGQFEVPLRLALVKEGIEPKTVWTKLYQVAVMVPPGQTNVPFVHVEEDMMFVMPNADELDAYVVYVGFDPMGAKEVPQKKPAPKKRRVSG